MDLLNQKFGSWTVLKKMPSLKNENNRHMGSRWLCKCDCGSERIVRWKILKNEKKPRSCGCSRKTRARQHFESHYEKTNGCWEWKGRLNKGGYGKFGAGRIASRLQYIYYYGPIAKELQVCHTCDNRRCVNPDHLFLGTAADNLKDMTQKGRRARGSKIASSVLTEEIVLEIRKKRLEGWKYKELEATYNLIRRHVHSICKNQMWQHVPLGEETKNYISPYDTNKHQHGMELPINEQIVFEMRKDRLAGAKIQELVNKYKLSFSTIRGIVVGKTWRHAQLTVECQNFISPYDKNLAQVERRKQAIAKQNNCCTQSAKINLT